MKFSHTRLLLTAFALSGCISEAETGSNISAKVVHLEEQGTVPYGRTNKSQLFSKDVSGTTETHIVNSAGTDIAVTRGQSVALTESGTQVLSIGAIADNDCVVRSGTTIAGVACSTLGGIPHNLTDDSPSLNVLQEGANSYMSVITTNGVEVLTLGSASGTSPDVVIPGAAATDTRIGSGAVTGNVAGSIAIGVNSDATPTFSKDIAAISIGNAAVDSGEGAVVIGAGADGNDAEAGVTIGNAAEVVALSVGSIAIGGSAYADLEDVAIGQGAGGSGNSVAVGDAAVSVASGVSIGLSSAGGATGDITIGYNTYNNGTTGDPSVIIGYNIQQGTTAGGSVGIGDAVAISNAAAGAVCVGNGAAVTGAAGVAIGEGTSAATGGVMIGAAATSALAGDVGIGSVTITTPTTETNVVIGDGANCTTGCRGTVLIGGDSSSAGIQNVVIGHGASVPAGGDAVAIGWATLANNDTTAIGEQACNDGASGPTDAVCVGTLTDAGTGGVAIGDTAVTTTGVAIGIGTTGETGVAIGNAVAATGTGVAIGQGAVGAENSVAVGSTAGATATGANSVLIGYSADGAGTGGVALGYGSTATGDYSTALGFQSSAISNYSLALGYNSGASAVNQAAFGSALASQSLYEFYFGGGPASTAPYSGGVLLAGTSGNGANVTAYDLMLSAGRGTGTGLGGHLKLQTAPSCAAGATVCPLKTRLEILDSAPEVIINADATSADQDLPRLVLNDGDGVPTNEYRNELVAATSRATDKGGVIVWSQTTGAADGLADIGTTLQVGGGRDWGGDLWSATTVDADATFALVGHQNGEAVTATHEGQIKVDASAEQLVISAPLSSVSSTWGSILETVGDNVAAAWKVVSAEPGLRDQIAITTTDGSEAIDFGNTSQNHDFTFLGSGTTQVNGLLDANAGCDFDGGSMLFNPASGSDFYVTTSGAGGDITLVSGAGQIAALIPDNTGNAFVIVEGIRNYIEVDTFNGSELVALGNDSTDPDIRLDTNGEIQIGDATSGATVDVNLLDDTATAYVLGELTRSYLSVATSNTTESMSFGNATTNPSYTFLGTGTTQVNGIFDANAGGDFDGGSFTVNTASGSNITLATSGALTTLSLNTASGDAGGWTVADNENPAWFIDQGVNRYMEVDTTNSSEVVTIGNDTIDPDLLVDTNGTIELGDVTSGSADVNIILADNTANAFSVWEASSTNNVYIDATTVNGTEVLYLGNTFTDPIISMNTDNHVAFGGASGTDTQILESRGSGSNPEWTTRPRGTFYFSTPATTSPAGTPTKANGTTTSVLLSGVTMPSNNRLTYTGTPTRTMRFHCALATLASGSVDAVYSVAENGTDIPNSGITRSHKGATDYGAVSVSWPVTAATNDYYELFVDAPSGTITVEGNCTLEVH